MAAGDALGGLGRAVIDDPSDSSLLGRVEQLAAATGDWAALARIYRAAASRPLALDQQIDLRCRLGRLYSAHLDEPDRAIATYRRVLDLSPRSAEVATALEGLYVRTERWGELLGYLDERGAGDQLIDVLGAHLPDTPDEQVDGYLAIARLCEERLGDPQRAIEAAERALDLDPGSLGALRTLGRLYREMGDHRRCLDMLDLELDAVAGDADRVAVLDRMARLCEESLDDIDRAAECVENILAIDEDRVEDYRRLATYYRRMAAWEELADCYQRHGAAERDPAARADLWEASAAVYRDPLADPEREIWVLAQLAELCETRLADADRAASTRASILALALGQESGLERARSTAEQLLRHPDHAVAAAQVLEPMYRDSDDHDGLVEVFEVLARHAEPWERSESLVRIAEVERARDRPEAALAALERALVADPSDPSIADLMEQLARDTDGWTALAAIYARLGAPLGCRLGRVYRDELGEPVRAIATYRAVLEHAAGAADADAADAADALEELYARTGRWIELADHLRERDSRSNLLDVYDRILPDDAEEQLRCYVAIARVCEQHLGDADQTVEAADRALSLDPDAPDALRALFERYRGAGAHERCLDTLERLLDATGPDEARIAVLAEMADLCERDLGDLDRAAGCVENLLALDPSRLDRYRQLAGYYHRMNAWQSLARCLERHLAVDPDPAVRDQLDAARARLRGDDPG